MVEVDDYTSILGGNKAQALFLWMNNEKMDANWLEWHRSSINSRCDVDKRLVVRQIASFLGVPLRTDIPVHQDLPVHKIDGE